MNIQRTLSQLEQDSLSSLILHHLTLTDSIAQRTTRQDHPDGAHFLMDISQRPWYQRSFSTLVA